jgi:hypothetical protein
MPRFVLHSPRSLELTCLHEAGHVLMLLKENVIPELVEVHSEPEIYGRTRAAKVGGAARRGVSSAGLAVEFALFDAGRLVDAEGKPVTEGSFLQAAVGEHAFEDKIMFFGQNRGADGFWPKKDDEAFIGFAQTVKAFLNMHFIEDFATELMEKGRLDADSIQMIAERHGV